MWQSLHDAWWRLATQRQPRTFSDTLACAALKAGACVYGGAVAWRNAAYDRHWIQPVRLSCPVISVGNLTVGGTGKTACVELIARKLHMRGRRVAILSRGYGGRVTRGSEGCWEDYCLRAEEGQLTFEGWPLGRTVGLPDEPQLLAQHLEGVSVGVSPQRAAMGRRLCRETGCDVILLDDGFQHRPLHRDCDIVLVSARMPLGGSALLPRGPLREPLESLRRAHVVIITKANEALNTLGALSERLRVFNRDLTLVTAVHRPVELWDPLSGQRSQPSSLEGRRVALLSSIGDPEGFENTVRSLHADLVWHQVFPDHHPYKAADVDRLVEHVQATKPDVVVTTEKDWVRLQLRTTDYGLRTIPLRVLGVRMKILSGEAELDDRLARLCAR